MKQLLLFLSISLLAMQTLFSQVPSNDLIANATLINSFPFTDNDVRLDLATASTISPSGCPLGKYNLVYYKFTALDDARLDVVIEDSNNAPIGFGTSFAIVLSATNLNVANDSELNILSPCAFSPSTSILLTKGTNYYILIGRNEADVLSDITFEESLILPVATSERDALIALYNSTDGSNWNNNTNWNSSELVANWYGVTTTNVDGVGHIKTLILGSNNLTGDLPTEIGNFPELTKLMLWDNKLTGSVPPQIGNLSKLVELDLSPNTFTGTIPTEIGNLVNLEILWLNQNGLSGNIPTSFQNLTKLRELHLRGTAGSTSEYSTAYSGDFPDLTALPLTTLDLKDNYFQFTDIVDEFATYKANIQDFTFSPQYTTDPPVETVIVPGNDIILTISDIPATGKKTTSKTSMSGNQYQWFKDNVALTTNANADTYIILNAQEGDSGIYYCEITNFDLPGMTIQSGAVTLSVTLSLNDNDLNNVNIYPNPTRTFININLNDSYNDASFSLYDISGRLILKQELNTITSKINIENLNSGIYLLQIKADNAILTKRIIKQ